MKHKILRFLRPTLAIFGLIAILWSGGLVWFAEAVQDGSNGGDQTTDAIVVPTGGSGRLEEGLRLLREGFARRMLISGVSKGVEAEAVIDDDHLDLLDCCIDLGHAALDTAGNAIETAAWMAAQGFSSLRIVTGSYHLPRTMMEFRRAMPNVTLVPNPVFPDHVKVELWWRYRGTAGLIASEYAKYLLALAYLLPSTSLTPHTR